MVSPSLASNAVVARDQDASTSQARSQSESKNGPNVSTLRKPTISKVILRAVADKGVHSRVSLAALKKAVSVTGYNMAQNTWRFKRVLQNLVKKGMLKQVTGKGASGSFRLGKKQAFKSKGRAKRCQQRQQKQQREQRQKPAQCLSGPRRSLLSSRRSNNQLFKGVHRVTKGCQ
ncbi:histone H1.9-like [Arvicanthis niloticus]|uniref:spermatid-specific linker histone H1-like protein n=1 Tax=Arvicanthis niloticus TaxID=61156 RepID=UPI001485E4B8|nr:spermatid-specific linker histone H1-like protein [Arvicanthis niloticus]